MKINAIKKNDEKSNDDSLLKEYKILINYSRDSFVSFTTA